MRLAAAAAIICICLFGTSFGQEPKYPFPQNITYPHGILPTKRDAVTEMAKKWYSNWKNKYLQECNGNTRPGVDPLSRSLVEAQGFAMVPIAYMGDKALFDKMYNFYKSKCVSSACGLMDWKVTCSGVEAPGAATDGDVDVACALLIAHWQWPDAGYDEKLKALLTNLKKLISSCGNLLVLHPGCGGGSPWGGCNETDISYYTPAFFRYFAEISGDEQWKKLADDTQIIRDNAANAQTGLVPDWQSVEGRAGAGSRVGYFAYDAIRAPYKQTMDFLWHGTAKAETWCKKLTTWAHNSVGVRNIVDGYDLNGNKRGSNHNMAVLGSMAVAAMANTQSILDAFVDETLTRTDGYWYSGYLGNLYLIALSGNMWNPDIVGKSSSRPVRVKAPALTSGNLKVSFSVNHTIHLSGLPEAGTVSIVTLSGQTLFRSAATGKSVSIDGSGLGSGCRIVKFSGESGRMNDQQMLLLP
jgi:endoglucanase